MNGPKDAALIMLASVCVVACYQGTDLEFDTDADTSSSSADGAGGSSPSGASASGSGPTGDTPTGDAPTGGSSTTTSGGSNTASDSDPTLDPDTDDETGTGGGSMTDTASGESSSDPSETGPDETSGGGDEPTPELPTADGPCPTFANGTLTFEPGETGSRQARVFFDPAAGGGGPLVFWFHGTGGSPDSSTNALSNEDTDAIVAMGGMVVMPWNTSGGPFPWYLVNGNDESDLHLMDEVVGCAAAGPGIDARHIHAAGFSAGGLHVAQAAIRRASYLASTVPISGGLVSENIPSDAPGQVISAMIFHGGASDNVAGLPFNQTSQTFANAVEDRGGYVLMCNHGDGHSYISDREYAWDFMQAHPFGTAPSPFETDGAPGWVPGYCN